jgi:monoamine oxidase
MANNYLQRQSGTCPPPPPLTNPTNIERFEILKYVLSDVKRPEDFDNVINLLSPPQDITTIASPGAFKNMRVAIIGAGLAGLASAFELRKLGFDITIFEALEDRVGGRVYTHYFDRNRALYGELGPMRIPISHETTWHYINLFNLDTRIFVQNNQNAYTYIRNVRVRNDPTSETIKENIYPLFNLTPDERNTSISQLTGNVISNSLNSMSPQIRKEILQIKPFYHPSLLYWDNLNIRQVFQSMGYSQPLINLIGSHAPLMGAFYYTNYIEILQEEYTADFSFHYEIIGGMSNLPIAFYKSLVSSNPIEYNIPKVMLGNVKFLMGNWVTGIEKANNFNKVTIKYGNKSSKGILQDDFDYVIITIPFSTLRNVRINPLFTARKMEAIREVTYEDSQKTLFLFSERFWEKGRPDERIVGGGSYTDMPIMSIWYPADHAQYELDWETPDKCLYKLPVNTWILKPNASPNEPGVLLASYNYTQDAIRIGNMDRKLRLESIKQQVEEVNNLPRGYLDPLLMAHKTIDWNKEEWFSGGFCYFSPEQKRLYSYTMIEPEYDNRVFFAGEHTSSKHAWMQGALYSGMKASNTLAYCCNFRRND